MDPEVGDAQEKERTALERIAIAGPLLPGKEEPWRRFVQELAGSRAGEYEALKRRVGVRNETIRLVRPPRGCYKGALVLVQLETGDPGKALQRLQASEHPFDLWLKERLQEFHGYGLASSPSRTEPELILDRRQTPEETNGDKG